MVTGDKRQEIANCEMCVVARLITKPSDKIHFQGAYLVHVKLPPTAPNQEDKYIEMSWEQLHTKTTAQKRLSGHFRYHVKFGCSDKIFNKLVDSQLATKLQDIVLATCAGSQPKLHGGVYVFSNTQCDYNGKLTNMLESGYMWPSNKAGAERISPTPTLVAGTNTPFADYFKQVSEICGKNTCMQVLVIIAAVLVALRNQDHNNPILLLVGPPRAGKTFLAQCGLSVLGCEWAKAGMMGNTTPAGLLQIFNSLGSLPFCWNDPQPNSKDIEVLQKAIIPVYDKASVNTAKHNKQYSAALWVTCNSKFLQQLLASEHKDEEKPKAERVVVLEMPKLEVCSITPEQQETMWRGASLCLSKLMGVQYNHEKHHELCSQLYDSELGIRITENIGLYLHYALEILVRLDDEIKTYPSSSSASKAPAISHDDVVAFFASNIVSTAKKYLGSKSAVARMQDSKGRSLRLATKSIGLDGKIEPIKCLEDVSTKEMYFDRQHIQDFFAISKENLKVWLRHYKHECITLNGSTDEWKNA